MEARWCGEVVVVRDAFVSARERKSGERAASRAIERQGKGAFFKAFLR